MLAVAFTCLCPIVGIRRYDPPRSPHYTRQSDCRRWGVTVPHDGASCYALPTAGAGDGSYFDNTYLGREYSRIIVASAKCY